MKKLLFACMATGLCLGSIQGVSASSITDTAMKETEMNGVESYSDLAFLKGKLDSYEIKYPSATEQEKIDYLNTVIQTDEFKNQKNTRSGIYLPGYDNLNSEEKKLVNENPVIAVAVYAWADEATTRTINMYGRNGADDNSDAFRHGCWNILMTEHIGYNWASRWATAHEATSSGLSKTMDLRNNQIGRNSWVSGKSDSQLASVIALKVNTGKMWRISYGVLVPTTGGRMGSNE